MWTDEDIEVALEWQRWQSNLCPGCGEPVDEAMASDGPYYEVVDLRCRACEARDVAETKVREKNGSMAGLKFSILSLDDVGGDG